jgi:hypothetical protein
MGLIRIREKKRGSSDARFREREVGGKKKIIGRGLQGMEREIE